MNDRPPSYLVVSFFAIAAFPLTAENEADFSDKNAHLDR